MNKEILKQKKYWNKEVFIFDSIYTAEKSKFLKWLDRIFRWDMFARYEYTFRQSGAIRDKTILDVGCGTGVFSLEYARRDARHVTGIDIAEQMIEVCKIRSEKEGLNTKCEFLKTDLLEYKPEKTFDICISIGLFDYIMEPQNVITKMRELVTDRAIMSFPRFWTWRAPIRKIRLGLRKCSVYFYRKKKIDTLIKTAGFKRYEIEKVGKLFCVTAYMK